MKSKKLVWFARGGDVARMGPFKCQEEAAQHTMVHAENCAMTQYPPGCTCDCQLRPIDGAFVWPEIMKRKGRLDV